MADQSDTIAARRWYVVQTRPHAEARAAMNLVRQGFETYLPVARRTRRHARRVDSVAVPFFPRYLFVSLDQALSRWRSINGTFGVSAIITSGDAPAPVQDGIVEALRARADADGFLPLGPERARLLKDQPVAVVGGAFDLCRGFFEAYDGGQRVAILLDLLGRRVRVVLPVDAVEAA